MVRLIIFVKMVNLFDNSGKLLIAFIKDRLRFFNFII